MTRERSNWFLSVLGWCALLGVATGADQVNESARQIPVAYEADVVVVGGGTGAVSAAVAAAKDGAKVFLAAPHPYLGDDMTATLRLWLQPGETPTSPLAQRVFGDRSQGLVDPNRIAFSYESDLPSASDASRHGSAQPADRRPLGFRFVGKRPVRRQRADHRRSGSSPGSPQRSHSGFSPRLGQFRRQRL